MWIDTAAVALSLVTFLGALHLMRSGLEGMAGGRLPLVLNRIVRTPTRGILTGIVATGLLQSSAAVTAISVGMVAGGSLLFRDAVGVVLGANVGSTVTPQLLALNLWVLAVPAFLAGGIAYFSRRPRWRNPGLALVGFASVFVALQSLTLALDPLSRTAWFKELLGLAAASHGSALLAGMIASAIVQSSTATTVFTMALAADGVLPLTSAVAVVLGANVGTCLTSVIAAIGQSRSAQRVALTHVLLNVLGVLAVWPWLGLFADLMRATTANASQQIANAHTLFNVSCTLLVWPLTGRFAGFVERLLPDHRRA